MEDSELCSMGSGLFNGRSEFTSGKMTYCSNHSPLALVDGEGECREEDVGDEQQHQHLQPSHRK